MKSLIAFDKTVSLIEKWVACIMLVTIVLVGTAQIIFRYALGSSLIWSEELMRYLFVWLSFLTASIAVREHKHISVDFLTTFLPAKVNKIFYFFSRIAMLVYIGFMVPAGFRLCEKTAMAKSTIIPITWNYVYAALPVGLILIFISMISVYKGDIDEYNTAIAAKAKEE